ncbi:30S ribosomal protein S7 isoform X1 [Nematostella vectensis]|nr:30S ribosomal protein S7 isoform X1 [Nematostella vectensis]
MAAKWSRFGLVSARSVLWTCLRHSQQRNQPQHLYALRSYSTRVGPLQSLSAELPTSTSPQPEVSTSTSDRHTKYTILSESDDTIVKPKPADSHRNQSAFDDELVNKFVNCMMWDGKKSLSQNIFTQAMQEIKKQQLEKQRSSSEPESITTDPTEIFHQAIENVKPVVGCIPLRKAGKVFQVPSPLNPIRRRFFAIKWIIDAARDQSGPKNARMHKKLAKELLDAYNNEGTAIRKKQDLHKRAEANRAFAHYRWW